MKALFFWILVLALVFGLSATHAAFAKPNNVNKAVATKQPGKPRTQLQNSGAMLHAQHVVARKTGKPERNHLGTKKTSSCINGTTIHSKH
jgi:hypothetical protein